MSESFYLRRFLVLIAALALSPIARAAEHITLKNGFELDCGRREAVGDRVRLYFSAAAGDASSFLEVDSVAILRIEATPESSAAVVAPVPAQASATGISGLLSQAGQRHRIDADLLASVVQAESGGHAYAVSRTGARGLMQLMPGTAHQLGVTNAFEPEQNIAGGSAYLDQLLIRYHDEIALALAAYNAGPAAVDHYRGVPPYRETQAYVARVINEFNRRKRTAIANSPVSLSR